PPGLACSHRGATRPRKNSASGTVSCNSTPSKTYIHCSKEHQYSASLVLGTLSLRACNMQEASYLLASRQLRRLRRPKWKPQSVCSARESVILMTVGVCKAFAVFCIRRLLMHIALTSV